MSTLKARTYVQACIRAAEAKGCNAAVSRRGYPEAGAVLLKLQQRGAGWIVLAQTRDAAGEPAWMRGTGPLPVPENEADAYIARAVARDADLWVVETEHGDGSHPLGERVL
jgi:hypothetical protein